MSSRAVTRYHVVEICPDRGCDVLLLSTVAKVSDQELANIPLKRHEFHGDWNYTIAQSDSR